MIVFATKYREPEIRELCAGLREIPELDAIPLLVAVDQYQMPLANRVREMPNSDFIVTPIEEHSLRRNLGRATQKEH
jgi:PleD family two-component response regulator